MICLDTSLLIDLLKERKEAIEKIKKLKNELLVTTRINIFEVLFGFFYKEGTKERFRNDIKLLIDKIQILEVDEIATIKAAEIASILTKKGEEIEHSDAIISGVMLTNGCTCIATKDSHFNRIKEIKVEGY